MLFKTNDAMRLHYKLISYLELINEANERYLNKKADLNHYDTCKDPFTPIRLMTNKRSDITDAMDRYQKVSEWLISKYQNVFTELGTENLRQLTKVVQEMDLHLSNNEV